MGKKPRSDSVLDSLSPEVKAQLRTWLVEENQAYDAVVTRLHDDFNVKTSTGALSRFYATECFALRSSEAKAFAERAVEELSQGAEKYDEATLLLIKQKAFERAYARNGNLDELQILAGIVGEAKKLRLKQEQLEFSREKFRQEIKSDVEKGLEALHAEIKGDAEALQLFEKMKARVLAAMGAAA